MLGFYQRVKIYVDSVLLVAGITALYIVLHYAWA